MSLPYNGRLIEYAKQLRKNPTPWEKKLWYSFLRGYKVRFQRQKVIDNYIVDFYCSSLNLAIELDGSQHYSVDNEEYEYKRTSNLEKQGLIILRFTNNDVDTNFYGVCTVIDNTVNSMINE